MFKVMTNSLKLSKEFLTKVIDDGSIVIDATAGNGKDTLFLAELVGDNGQVIAFDIQQEALDKCSQLLKERSYQDRVKLVLDSHENLDKYVTHPIDGAMFNLGYLPGGDNSIITEGRTTCIAIQKVLELLKPGGVVSIVVYPGHSGGSEEGQLIEELVYKLDQKNHSVAKIDFPNRINNSPFLILIEKAGGIRSEK